MQQHPAASSLLLAPPASTSHGIRNAVATTSDLEALIPLVGAASRCASLFLSTSLVSHFSQEHTHTHSRKKHNLLCREALPLDEHKDYMFAVALTASFSLTEWNIYIHRTLALVP